MFNMKTGAEESSYNCHDSQVTNLQVRIIYKDHQRQIILRIVGYHFSSRLTAILNLCSIYLKLLVHLL